MPRLLRESRWAGLWLALGALALAEPVLAAGAVQPDELALDGRSAIVLGSGARAFGMGGAFLARADDATAASWNPAGLSYLIHPELCLVGVRNAFDLKLATSGGELTNDDRLRGNAPDFFGLAVPVSVGNLSGTLQVSYQRAIAFQDHDIWRKGGSSTTTDKDIQIDAHGGFDTLAVGSGFKLSRGVRVGLTVNRWLNGYQQSFVRHESPNLNEAREFREFDLRGWNVNCGVIFTPIDSLNIGGVFKTPLRARARMKFTAQNLDHYPLPGVDNLYQRTETQGERGDLRLDFPGALGFGVSWRHWSPFTVSLDYTRTFWSKSRIYNYFTVPPSGGMQTFTVLRYPTLKPSGGQVDTEQIRVGAEYVFIHGRFKWPVRGGYFNDRQLFLTDLNKAPRFNGVSAGVGVIIDDRMLFDAALVHEAGSYVMTPDPSGRVGSMKAYLLYLSFIYRYRKTP